MDALLCLVYNTGMGGIVNDANFTKALQDDDVTAITRCFKSKPHKDRREWELKVYLSLPSENWPPHPNAPLSRMAKSAINTVQQEDNDEMYNILARYGYTEMYSTNSSSRSEELAIYASTHTISQNEKGGRCALYVRKALMGALKLKTKGHPHSACAYWDLLEFWGFKRIYHGLTTQYNGEYQNGDIIVTSGLVNGPRGEKDKHGHIQIYYNGKWYADKCFNNANVYSKKGDRTCFLYRIM